MLEGAGWWGRSAPNPGVRAGKGVDSDFRLSDVRDELTGPQLIAVVGSIMRGGCICPEDLP